MTTDPHISLWCIMMMTTYGLSCHHHFAAERGGPLLHMTRRRNQSLLLPLTQYRPIHLTQFYFKLPPNPADSAIRKYHVESFVTLAQRAGWDYTVNPANCDDINKSFASSLGKMELYAVEWSSWLTWNGTHTVPLKSPSELMWVACGFSPPLGDNSCSIL